MSDRCSCCLSPGKHSHLGDLHVDILRNCLNLILIGNSSISAVICTGCVRFLHDARGFRKMVISSQKQLLAVLNNSDLDTDAVNAWSHNNSDVNEESKVKQEEEVKSNEGLDVVGSEVITANEIDHKGESELKIELDLHSGYHSSWESFEDEYEIKNENESNKSIKSKRKKNIAKIKLKRRKYDDSESDTPISEIKKKKARLKNEIENELDISITAGKESKKHSFLDNNKVRSNIILLLKHSTILPFRNNFKSTYKCFYCEKLYIPFKELKEHVEKEHYDVTEATIEKIVKSLQNLIVTADISLLKCRLCNQEYKSIENLVEHLCDSHKKIYHQTDKKPSHGILGVDLSTDTLKCHLCNKDFAFFKNLSVHMNEHYGLFVCYVCGKKFLSEHRYQCHVFNAHTDKETKCKHCGKVFSTEPSMAYHVRKEHLKRMIKCLKCTLTFPLGQYVKRLNHMAEAHGIKKPIFKCDTCGREYANSGSLAGHKRNTHNRTKEHKCDICGYITPHNYVMKNHMDVHNGIKNYECEFCKKKFAKPYTLKIHLKIHLNDKRFVCTLCDAAFIQKNSLKSHLKSRHPDSGIDINKL